MWYKKQAELLREELETLLKLLVDTAGLYELTRKALTGAGRGIFADKPDSLPWPLLPLMVCETVSGRFEPALPAAASIQLLKTAAEVFDDVEDADSPESLSSRYGPALAVNAATTLLILSEKVLAGLKARGVEDSIIVRIMESISSYYTTACAGQHLDISHTGDLAVTEELYMKIISLKSATTAECACYTGALLGQAGPDSLDKFARFGHNLGMMSQIVNDIQGVTGGKDIIRRKITLPVIYALSQTRGETYRRLERAFSQETETAIQPGQIKDLLFQCGAVHYSVLRMELYKQRAAGILAEMEAGFDTGQLKQFLE